MSNDLDHEVEIMQINLPWKSPLRIFRVMGVGETLERRRLFVPCGGVLPWTSRVQGETFDFLNWLKSVFIC